MNRADPQTKRIAIVIDNLAEYGRRAVRGIIDFAETRGDWELHYDFDYGLRMPRSLSRPYDGLITQSSRLMRAATREPWGQARVGTFIPPRRHRFPSVCEDNYATGALACDYLANLGFRRLAMCSLHYEFAIRQSKGFFAAASKMRLPTPQLFTLPAHRPHAPWHARLPAIQAWLSALPTPIGLFAVNDLIGRLVLAAARQVGVMVPDQAAVVSVDDDEPLCRLTIPPLSSIDQGAYQVGYEAAALLDRILHGDAPPLDPLIVPPVRVVARRSTDALAVSDPDAALAIRHIRRYARDRVTVRSVLRAVPVSRTKLEREFRKLFGRSINQEILRYRVELAKEELMRGNAGILDIAVRCGFANRQLLNMVFKNLTGETPTGFRARFQVEPTKEHPPRFQPRVE
jgi:LacI family transcriptional regulator